MSLHILYGNQLQKADSVLFSKIKECIDNGQNVLYIVPEQYSFNADKTLLNVLGEKYTHLTETVNFKRLATTVNKKYAPNKSTYIDDETKTLLIYKIIKENATLLSTVKNRRNSPDSVLIFKNILSECKSCLIDHQTLETVKNNLDKNTFLYQKICDLDFIITQYQAEISEKFSDFEDSFHTLANCIDEHSLYRDYEIFVEHFTGFSPAEYLVISALLKQAKNIYLPLMLDDLSKKEPGDLFFPTYKTYEQLIRLANRQNQTVSALQITDATPCFFAEVFDAVPMEAAPDNFSLTNAKNQQDEIRFVMETIQKLTAQGASYSDFTVLTGDLSVYCDDLEKAFLEAGIPCFIDKKTPLTKNPLSKIFLTMLSAVNSGYQLDAVSEYLKSLCAIYNIHDEVCIFEELLYQFRIQKQDLSNADRWHQKCEFIKHQNNYFTKQLETILTIYETFLSPVIKHFSKPNNYLHAFRCFSGALHLEETVQVYLSQKEASLRNETANAYNTILTAIKNIDTLIGTEHITPQNYYILLKQSLELYETGEIPNTLDAVTISDTDRGRNLSSPYVFILGMNEGITPKTTGNSSYLSDLERETISEITGIDLPTSLSDNASSVFSLYRAFLSATKHLYLCKNEAESDHAKRTPSFIWKRLAQFATPTLYESFAATQAEYNQKAVSTYCNPYKQRLTPQAIPNEILEDERKASLHTVLQQIGEMKDEGYYSTDKKLSRKILSTKYQKQLNTSVTRLESYQKCSYAYFVNYILNVSERENVSYDMRKTGSIIHNLFDRFSKRLKADNLTWETVEDSYIEAQIEQLVPKEIAHQFPELSLFNPRTKYLIKKFKRLLRTAIAYIREHFCQGDFVPIGYEIPIGDDGIAPLTIALEDGSVMQLYGKIDRCDAAKSANRLFVRIIDYKSSAKEFNFTLIKDGIQLQLLTYLQTVLKNGGEYLNFSDEILPGAVFYTSFDDSLVSFKDKPAPDEVAKKIRQKFTMKGFVLNDDSLICAIDRQLGSEPSYQSGVCEIKTDAKGQYKLKHFLFMEEFKRLLNDCEETIKTIGTKMMSGDISIKPYRYGKETGCDWCPYASVCMFDPKMHPYRNLKKLSKDEYFKNQTEETAGENHGN